MLWYGYIYYIIFSLISMLIVLFLLRSLNLVNLFRLNSGLIINRLFIANILFFLFLSFTLLNNLMQFYQDIILITPFSWGVELTLVNTFTSLHLLNASASSLSLIEVYYYPFIYVFLIVTVLSIVFCLSYNKDELMSFMFYCQLILLAGYALFFTDSIILFFLAYEMLLVPSFFILYKFAKTRRCVEAAYLMFF